MNCSSDVIITSSHSTKLLDVLRHQHSTSEFPNQQVTQIPRPSYQLTGFSSGPQMWPNTPGGSPCTSCVTCPAYQTTTSWSLIGSPFTKASRFASVTQPPPPVVQLTPSSSSDA